ncbi:signal peptidase I [Candidatus Roizmanbacteria bacterium]|nr:signal peptidase I [Candidatus Roizmanbacteria bacterium]
MRKSKNPTQNYCIGMGRGTSMNPLIRSGDLIYICKTKHKIYINDIVVFYDKKILISHRIIGKKRGLYITKGDNSIVSDRPISNSQIIGKVIKLQGIHGTIHLDNLGAKIVNFYLLIYSYLMKLLPLLAVLFVKNVFRGRRFLVKLIAVKT